MELISCLIGLPLGIVGALTIVNSLDIDRKFPWIDRPGLLSIGAGAFLIGFILTVSTCSEILG